MNKEIALMIAVLLSTVLFTSCSQPQAPASETTATTAGSAPTETEPVPEETEPTEPDLSIHGFEQYQEDLFDFPSYRWKSDGPEWYDASPYTSIAAVSTELFRNGFVEVNFERQLTQVTPPNSRIEVNAFRTNGELYVVRFTLISNAGSSAETRDEWELHAAQTGEFADISGIGSPYPDYIFERAYNSVRMMELMDYCSMNDAYVSLYFSRTTGNMYSLHAADFHYSPTILYYETGKRLPHSFTYIPPKEPSLYCFTVEFGTTGESASYEFLIGSSFSQWISSEYNTDGWAYDPNDRSKILSPDKQYYVKASDIITPKVIANPC